jgi:hypothetical protein
MLDNVRCKSLHNNYHTNVFGSGFRRSPCVAEPFAFFAEVDLIRV